MTADKWIEAGARALCEARTGPGSWIRANEVQTRALMFEAHACLRAFLAAAEADGVVVVRVPDATHEDDLSRYRQGLELGWNNCRAAVLAGKVVL